MTWSWKLARIAGINVYMHATFLMLIGWIAVVHWSEGRTVAAAIEGVGFILALFAVWYFTSSDTPLQRGAMASRLAISHCFLSAGWPGSNECLMSHARNCGSLSRDLRSTLGLR